MRSLDLHGQTLTVVETTGQSLRVEGVSGLDFNTLLDLAMQDRVGVTITGDTGPGVLVTQLYALLPVLVSPLAGVIVLLLVIRLLRHPPAYPPAA